MSPILIGIVIGVVSVLLFSRFPKRDRSRPETKENLSLGKPNVAKLNGPKSLPPELAIKAMSREELTQLEQAKSAFLALYREGLVGRCTNEVPKLTDTRIGGPSVWPVGVPLPSDPQGRAMVQLAHINLADLPQINGLPREGVLQVHVAADDLLGCKFPSENGDGVLVVLHPADSVFERVPQDGTDVEYTPIYKPEISAEGRKITWDKRAVPPPAWHYKLPDPYSASQERSPGVAAAYEDFLNDQADLRGLYDIMLLGHPDFTQEDPRYNAKYAGMENLIGFSSSGGAFMWGDVGEACILMAPADLAGFDLSKAIYYYDCC